MWSHGRLYIGVNVSVQSREHRWLPSVYDIQRVSQLYNSTQSPRPCRISSKPYSPYLKSHHLPKIVRITTSDFRVAHIIQLTLLYAVKAGYPPRALTAVIPELPLSSLGLAPGDQLIVVQKPGSAATAPTLPSSSPVNPAYPGHQTPAAARPSSNSNPRQEASVAAQALSTNKGPDYVAVDGGYLIHRVRASH